MIVSEQIISKRMARNLSRAKLSSLSGVPLRTLQDWETGKRIPRDVYQIWRVSSALGISIEEYLGLDTKPAEKEQTHVQV